MKPDEPVSQSDLQQMRELAVALLLQSDQADQSLRRLRWWTLTLAILVLCLSIIVWRLT